LVDIKSSEKELNTLKKELDKVVERDKELYSKKSSISEVLEYLKEEVLELKTDYDKKKGSVKSYEDEVKNKGKVEYLAKFINNLRGLIKDVRSVIRQKFLSDFRFEFQKKFEEIRNQEEEYSVELGFDYEPIAYTTSGEDVPVNHLSGGEKTSVALAYRLALSNLAAQMSNVTPAELLILDEPTTGFDAEDIKTLPEALNNITSIPQIIIVTHEPLLKEIADHNIEVRKERNESIIEI
jgi:exonuclease SbcC